MAYVRRETIYDLNREINFLNTKFREATKKYGSKNLQGTDLYDYQVEFAYKLNKLNYAPSHVLHKIVFNIHSYINEISKV